MPAPTFQQSTALASLYEQTKGNINGAPSYAEWMQQIVRQGQWDRDVIENVLRAMRRRRSALAASRAQWVDGHHLINGTVYHVHALRNAARRRANPDAREVHSLDLDRRTTTGRATWRFRGRAWNVDQQALYGTRMPAFDVSTLMTPRAIAEFGSMHGFCGICGRTLTVAESVERGVGPICWQRVMGYAALIEQLAQEAVR